MASAMCAGLIMTSLSLAKRMNTDYIIMHGMPLGHVMASDYLVLRSLSLLLLLRLVWAPPTTLHQQMIPNMVTAEN